MRVDGFLFQEDSAKKDYERICALPECNQALARNDKDPHLWNKRCRILIALEWYNEAIKAGKTAVELAPDDPEVWETLYEAYRRCNDREHGDPVKKMESE
jgi:predicted Zn-dependent protease